jgi:hypothetical protein
MSKHVIFFGWNHSITGREQMSAAHMQDFLQYVGGLQAAGDIESFETVLLRPHGGDLNGFFLIRGDASQLDAVEGSDEWLKHLTRAGLHLEGAGSVRGVRDEGVMDWMNLWTSILPT